MVRKLIVFLAMIFLFTACDNRHNGINSEKVLWEDIEKKVWIAQNWNSGEAYEGVSFVVTSAQNGKIEGEFSNEGMIKPGLNMYSYSDRQQEARIIGDYEGNTAACTIWRDNKIVGKLKMLLKSEDNNYVEVEFIGEAQESKYSSKFKVYNIKEIISDPRARYEVTSKDVELNKWGQVQFVSVCRTSERRRTLFIYLADCDKNVLYDFSEPLPFPNDFKVAQFTFKDMNQDGREDLRLVLEGITDAELREEREYEQNELGGFENKKESA